MKRRSSSVGRLRCLFPWLGGRIVPSGRAARRCGDWPSNRWNRVGCWTAARSEAVAARAGQARNGIPALRAPAPEIQAELRLVTSPTVADHLSDAAMAAYASVASVPLAARTSPRCG